MLKKTALTLLVLIGTASLAEARCRGSLRGRTVTSNRVMSVQTPTSTAKPAAKTEAAPVASGCSSGNCGRTSITSRFRLFAR